jgi:hypothetical protein
MESKERTTDRWRQANAWLTLGRIPNRGAAELFDGLQRAVYGRKQKGVSRMYSLLTPTLDFILIKDSERFTISLS